jgi:hypothetical protein
MSWRSCVETASASTVVGISSRAWRHRIAKVAKEVAELGRVCLRGDGTHGQSATRRYHPYGPRPASRAQDVIRPAPRMAVLERNPHRLLLAVQRRSQIAGAGADAPNARRDLEHAARPIATRWAAHQRFSRRCAGFANVHLRAPSPAVRTATESSGVMSGAFERPRPRQRRARIRCARTPVGSGCSLRIPIRLPTPGGSGDSGQLFPEEIGEKPGCLALCFAVHLCVIAQG